MEQINNFLQVLGCECIDVARDGNCLPRALLKCAYQDENLHLELRQLLAWENFRAWCLNPKDDDEFGIPSLVRVGHGTCQFDGKPLDYLRYVSTTGVWLCISELAMFSRYFQICIVVHQVFDAIIDCQLGEDAWPQLHLILHCNHYMAVMQLSREQSLPAGKCRHIFGYVE